MTSVIDATSKVVDAIAKGLDVTSKDVDAIAKGLDATAKGLDAIPKDVDAIAKGLDATFKDVDAIAKGFGAKSQHAELAPNDKKENGKRFSVTASDKDWELNTFMLYRFTFGFQAFYPSLRSLLLVWPGFF